MTDFKVVVPHWAHTMLFKEEYPGEGQTWECLECRPTLVVLDPAPPVQCGFRKVLVP